MKTEQLRPVGNSVVIRDDVGPSASKGGVYLPQQTISNSLQIGGKRHRTGVVVAVGPGIGESSGIFVTREAGTKNEPRGKIAERVLVRPQDTGIRVGSRVVFIDGFGTTIHTEDGEGRIRIILAGAIEAEIPHDAENSVAEIETAPRPAFSRPIEREGAWDERVQRDT